MGLIRFILAVSVVAAHAGAIFGLHLVGGRVAVQSFYVISGFYMSLVLNEKYLDKKNSYRLFIGNRFLRLFPVYWTVLLCVLAYSLVIHFLNIQDNGAFKNYIEYFNVMNISSFLFLVLTNVGILFQDWVMFMGINIYNGMMFFTGHPTSLELPLSIFLFIPQAWSIGVELTFYLIAPFVVKKPLKWVLLLMFLSLSLRAYLMTVGLDKDPWTYRFFPTELFFFLLGNVSYCIYKKICTVDIKTIYFKLAFYFILFFIALFEVFHFKLFGYLFVGIFSLLLPFIFCLTKNWKVDTYVGELSYPIYISHVFVLDVVLNVSQSIESGAVVLLFTILFSVLLNECVSKKVEKIRQKRVLVSNN
jgi:peptidoglycan/LPS O-acetylase OafA/YrhL